MNDRELLELAAKAVGRRIYYNYLGSQDCNRAWYPLENGGDALQLAVNLRIGTDCYVDSDLVEYCCAWINHRTVNGFFRTYEPYGDDPEAATRRAIVLCAAEIGKAMP